MKLNHFFFLAMAFFCLATLTGQTSCPTPTEVPKSDLVLESFATEYVANEDLRVGLMVKATFVVRNQGKAVFEDTLWTYLEVYGVSYEDQWFGELCSADSYQLRENEKMTIQPGEKITLESYFFICGSGEDYQLIGGVSTNSGDPIIRNSEQVLNKDYSFEYRVDLMIDAIDTWCWQELGDVPTYMVCNIGSTNLGTVPAAFFYDGFSIMLNGELFAVGPEWNMLVWPGVHDSLYFSFDQVPFNNGSNEIQIMLDPFEAYEETSEMNNDVSFSIWAYMPDLALVYQECERLNSEYRCSFEMRNIGSSEVLLNNNFKKNPILRVTGRDELLGAWSAEGYLYPNDSWSFGVIIGDAQNWVGATLSIEIDPMYTLTDGNRSNNYSSLTLE